MLKLCDSISIKILSRDTILAGVGNGLRVYTRGQFPSVQSLKWKLKNKIHGIEYDNGQLLIFGEREFIVLTYDGQFQLLCKGKISDWISSGKLLDDSMNRICLVTSHSVALGLSICPGTKSCTVESNSSCTDKSTVYCSLVVANSTKDCTVFAGTAFGELIVWQPVFGTANIKDDFRRPILHRISCHNGVIFSIDVSIPLRVIITTSDDRSVRFWNVKQTNKNAVFNWRDTSIISHCSVYGHGARVFKARIINKDKAPYVISVGEDSHFCIWNMNGTLLFKRRHHFGATIWNFDYDFTSKILFSTSSDGNVISYDLNNKFHAIQPKELKSEILDFENLAKIRYVSKDSMIAVTNRNRLVYRTLNNDWKFVDSFSDYKCTLLEVFKDLVAIAGHKMLTLYKIEAIDCLTKILEMEILDNTIRSFYFLSENEFLVCDDNGECKYSQDNFRTSITIEIPSAKERWPTAALKCDKFLIVSNRQGNMYLYNLENDEFKLRSTLRHVHGYLGATNINLESNFEDVFSVKTAGHDSTIKTFKIDKKLQSMSAVFTENVPISWIERVYKTSGNEKYVVGFNDNHFVIWERKQDVVFQMLCGGGHRCWDLILDYKNNSIDLIFIKNKLLYSVSTVLDQNCDNNFKIPYYSWHIKSCNTLESFQQNNSTFVLISGGEDNFLKFSKFSLERSNEIQLIENMYLHVSSIKSVSVVRETASKYLIFSVGGRAQICVTEFDSNANTIEERANFMLKSSDSNRKYQRNMQEIDFDPETRFLSVQVVRQGDFYNLYLACSDGFIRKFTYRNNLIEPNEKIFYDKCILHINLVFCMDQFYLLSAATDGFICFWDLNNFIVSAKPILKIKHHNSGINSIDIKLKNDLMFIVTGGDDQNVTISKLKIIHSNFEVFLLENLGFLHTAQVNGVKISACLNYFYTTSIDQTICKVDLNSFKLVTRVVTCIADVKGLEVFDSEGYDHCIVYGSGIEICKL